jgi:hypothetical protein
MEPGWPLIVVLILALDKLSRVSPACTAGSAKAVALIAPNISPQAIIFTDILTPSFIFAISVGLPWHKQNRDDR